MNEIRASVIIVSFNCREDLVQGLPGLAASLGPRDEAILVDNASQDESAGWVEANYPRVRVLRAQANLGYGGGNNLGAQAARGEYLVFLNPDTSVEPGWLDPLVASLESDAAVGMATPMILLKQDRSKINTCGNDVHLSGLTLCRGMGRSQEKYAESVEVAAVSGAAFAIRRDTFLRLGGFDDDFFLYMEDTDLSLRARLAGLRILSVPQSRIYHAYRLRFGPFKVFYQERNRYLMLLKNLRWATLVLLLPMFLWAEVITWGFVFLNDHGRIGNKLKAIAWLFGHAPAILEKRRRIQLLREVGDRRLLSGHGATLDFEQLGQGRIFLLAGRAWNLVSRILGRLVLLPLWW